MPQVWEYEGDKNLAHYLNSRDPLGMLAEDMQVDRWAAPATVAKQLFEGLAVSLMWFGCLLFLVACMVGQIDWLVGLIKWSVSLQAAHRLLAE